jgi:DNA-binding CsgD family transcriptional regulator/tetratricopeptide (TPR) repeat protein
MNRPLIARLPERARLDELIAAIRAGQSRTLVVRGAAGIGKSALVDYAGAAATGMRVLRATGVESEMELAFATLHQLCLPLFDRIGALPGPRRNALETVFRMRAGAAPDPFLVGLAVLDLLSSAAEQQPVLCLVDDVQWLDQASAQVLGFVARRLLADSIGLIFGTRPPSRPELRGLADLEVTGLGDGDAHVLLESVVRTPLDEHVRDRIVAETGGNPLALIELPRGIRSTQMAGGLGLGLLGADALSGHVERSFLSRVAVLPEQTRLLLLIAAAEPLGDPDLVRRAATTMGVRVTSVDGLLTIDDRVTFRHPLVRSAVYRTADIEQRRAVHRALAEASDAETALERRAWHRAAAATGPDEDVADELERAAGRTQARGGVAATAAFLNRSAALTLDSPRRADRTLAAAEASLRAGDFEAVSRLLRILDARSLDTGRQGRADLLAGQLAYSVDRDPGTAIALLLRAAEQLATTDPDRARETALHAWAISVALADRDPLVALSRSIRDTLPSGGDEPLDLILDGATLLVTQGRSAAAPVFAKAAAAVAQMPITDVIRWGRISAIAAFGCWDVDGLLTIATRQVHLVREAGALQNLPENLINLGYALVWTGEFAGAGAVVEELDLITTVLGRGARLPYVALQLLALRGQEAEAAELIGDTLRQAVAAGHGAAKTSARWAAAILYNGLARYPEAMRYAREADEHWDPLNSPWVLPELVESAVRTGELDIARNALDRLIETTGPFGTDYPAGLQARSQALVADGPAAGLLYREAIERLGRTRMRPDLARAHLLHGEWLRRRDERAEARIELHTAYEMFTAIGMRAFAERSRRELLASGGTLVRHTAVRHTDETPPGEQLTAQEQQIATLVRDGLSNPEVAARLFLSPRTIEWHLSKIYTKLGISSRKQLRTAPTTRDRSAIAHPSDRAARFPGAQPPEQT